MKKLIFGVIITLIVSACGKSTLSLPSVNGSKYEILIVMSDSAWQAPSGRKLVEIFNSDMESLPQSEPIMSIIHVNRGEFTDFLKPSRNILIAEIDAKYKQPKVVYTNNTWAQPQSLVKVTAANEALLESTINKYGNKILEYFLKSERDRTILYGKEYINQNLKKEVEDLMGIQIDIPSELNKIVKSENFIWITNDNPSTRKDLVIYTYPYTDKKMFTMESLLDKRDSVMKKGIPGEFKDSYMGTEKVHSAPFLNEIWVNGEYCAELKGLWRMYNGASMGGPFYSHSRLDAVNNRIVTVEGFVFAPGVKKRNHIRDMEAIIYTMKLPQEINELKEVNVVADKE